MLLCSYSTNAKHYPLEHGKAKHIKLYLMLTSVEIFARVSVGPNHEVFRGEKCTGF